MDQTESILRASGCRKDDKIFLSFGGENNDSYNNWI
nr:MAG TPA: hypothetical protein [Caudoviricetes sp.]